MKTSRGFTLIELLVTVTVLAVLLAVAAPSFQDASVSGKVSDNANRIAVSTSLARSEAIKRNAQVILCRSADGSTCAASGGWEQGWIMFADNNPRNGSKDAGEEVLRQEGAAPAGYKITAVDGGGTALSALIFSPTVVGSTAGTFTICRATPSVNSNQRQVDVSTTGRASVKKLTATTCT